jgi:diguanylate cyclase (GGDEF)-like protein/PAS domain S-box-containing protein
MKMKPAIPTEAAELRAQAESVLSARGQAAQPLAPVDYQRLLQELQVHQIELELQNEELLQSRTEVEILLRRYTDLYDFAPVGYLSLAPDGAILQVNLAGAKLLGLERAKLIKRRFGLFLSSQSRPAFSEFLVKVFSVQEKQTCETELNMDGATLWVRIEAIRDPASSSECQVVLLDITERKLAKDKLRRAQDSLESAHHELQQAFDREQKLSRIDMLTGINNRRCLVEFADHEFDVAMRYRPPLCVLMFDVDNFKHINDTFGHFIGDQVLKHVSQAACASLRSADIIGRYGGDEFLILLPQTSAQEALPLAERILTSIASQPLETDKGQFTITISLGIAQTIHSPGPTTGSNIPFDSVEKLLVRADQAMYAAKKGGRNRTVIFGPK